jgi:hypothetical protein
MIGTQRTGRLPGIHITRMTPRPNCSIAAETNGAAGIANACSFARRWVSAAIHC